MYDKEKAMGKTCPINNEYRQGLFFDVTCSQCLGKNIFRVENRTQRCTHCGAVLMRRVSFTVDTDDTS